jgi:xylan 1,4-beta-xylosidase
MPGEIHSLKSTKPNELYVFKINPKSYKEIFEFERIRLDTNKISPDTQGYDDLKSAVLTMAYEYTEKKPGYEFAIRSAKNNIITALLRELEYKYIDTSNNLRLFNRINLYLENNYAQQITLEDIGVLCHLSKYYFAHEFKRLTGISFMNYLTLFRLEKAIEMLMFSRENMTDIAMRCGFGNVRSFNRKFKEIYGKTPLEYKKSLTRI